MTKEEKARIIAMRGGGHTYAEIAAALSLSINTVKSFCRRQNAPVGSGAVCKHCGKPIVVRDKCKPRQFCSDACRAVWWKERAKPQKKVYRLTCVACGAEFECSGNRQQKYCSHGCYIAARFGKGREVRG